VDPAASTKPIEEDFELLEEIGKYDILGPECW
jgi:hypothetical protein